MKVNNGLTSVLILAALVGVLVIGAHLLSENTLPSPSSNKSADEAKPQSSNPVSNPSGDSSQRYPTRQRYVNRYESTNEPRNWSPEEGNVSLDNPGTYEVTRYPDAEPTAEQINNSWILYNRTYEAAERNGWFDYQNAVKEGYVDYVLTDGLHHYNTSYYLDREALNPDKPESLIYYEDPENESNQILAGVMYQNMKKEGEQVGGPLTIWHYHPIVQWKLERLNEVIEQETRYERYRQIINNAYEEVPENRLNRTGEMIHVWFVEHPRGPFGTGMGVPSDSLEEPTKISKDEFETRVMKNTEFSP